MLAAEVNIERGLALRGLALVEAMLNELYSPAYQTAYYLLALPTVD
mgnify:CR=1 FL=1